jgi:acetyl esterase/lipase
MLCPVLLLAAACTDDDAAPPPTTLRPPDQSDIAYGPVPGCGVNDEECGGSQQLDIFRSPVPGPNPVMVWFHGGGGVAGDKAPEVPEGFQVFLDEGWDIVSANYRLANRKGANPFPTGLLDAKRAIRWVKANAAAQDWDARRVVASGHSLGGNLAQMVATTAGDPSLEPKGLPADLAAQDSSVFAAFSVSAVSDLPTMRAAGGLGLATDVYVGCRTECPARLQRASVVPHVTAAAAPIVAVHGALDTLAPPAVGEAVKAAYARAGIGDLFTLLVISDGSEDDQGHTPDFARVSDDVLAVIGRR